MTQNALAYMYPSLCKRWHQEWLARGAVSHMDVPSHASLLCKCLFIALARIGRGLVSV